MSLVHKEVIINQIQLLFPCMPFFKCNRDNWEKKYRQYRDCIRIIENLDSVKAIPIDKIEQAREEIEKQSYPESAYGLPFGRDRVVSMDLVWDVLDKLIESEG